MNTSRILASSVLTSRFALSYETRFKLSSNNSSHIDYFGTKYFSLTFVERMEYRLSVEDFAKDTE